MYDDLFIPVVCGRCEPIQLQDGNQKEEVKTIKVHHNIIEGWTAFNAVQNWCGSNVSCVQTFDGSVGSHRGVWEV